MIFMDDGLIPGVKRGKLKYHLKTKRLRGGSRMMDGL